MHCPDVLLGLTWDLALFHFLTREMPRSSSHGRPMHEPQGPEVKFINLRLITGSNVLEHRVQLLECKFLPSAIAKT